jgi:hypothetical protein
MQVGPGSSLIRPRLSHRRSCADRLAQNDVERFFVNYAQVTKTLLLFVVYPG